MTDSYYILQDDSGSIWPDMFGNPKEFAYIEAAQAFARKPIVREAGNYKPKLVSIELA